MLCHQYINQYNRHGGQRLAFNYRTCRLSTPVFGDILAGMKRAVNQDSNNDFMNSILKCLVVCEVNGMEHAILISVFSSHTETKQRLTGEVRFLRSGSEMSGMRRSGV